jgi:MFS family permease
MSHHASSDSSVEEDDLALAAARNLLLLRAENFLIAFGVGTFLTLPLALKLRGLDEVFFGQMFAAGAIGALLCSGTSSFLLQRFGLAAIAPWGSGTFCAGSVVLAACMAQPDAGLGWYVGSVLQGMGWGLFLTQGPICLSTLVGAKRQAYHFMLYGAFNTLGIGLAPLVCRWALDVGNWSFTDLYCVAAVVSGVACLASVCAAWRNRNYGDATPPSNRAGEQPALRAVLKLPSVWFVAMVFLCACVYTSMMNFQTTLAAARHIDYAVFYGFYMLAVVAARFGLSGPLSRLSPSTTVPGLALLMVAALVLLYFSGASLMAYAGGALSLGVAYGLLYPNIQAQASAHAPAELRSRALIAFSLSYLVARYLFPYAGAKLVALGGYDALLVALVVLSVINACIGFAFYRRRRHIR